LWPSGHIPGSNGILAEGKKRVFYTSDIQTTDSHLLKKCQLPQNVDTLVIESTYGLRNRLPREHLEQLLIESVDEALSNDEIVLMPVFAVGRAQEVMMILEKYANRIVMDGMARLASDIIADYSYYLREPNRYKAMLKKIKFAKTDEDRKKAEKAAPETASRGTGSN